MARDSKIPWTGPTWNPIRGCDPVSPGCKYCYAVRIAHRFSWGRGLTVIRSDRPAWSGQLHFVREKLDEPLRWRKPRRVFPCSGADLFHEGVPFEYVAAMFGVMAAARRHTFQVLTKRADRIPEFYEWLLNGAGSRGWVGLTLHHHARQAGVSARLLEGALEEPCPWPLPNVWLGTSVENPDYLWRVERLLEVEAAVSWVSAEPLLARIDFSPYLQGERKLGWVVVGGESGRIGYDCRPCAMEWIDEIKDQCLEARVPVFVKQLGSWVVSEERMAQSVEEANDLRRACGHTERDDPWLWSAGLKDAKGEDPDEWPKEMRVRTFPGDELPDPAEYRYDTHSSEECPF